MAGCKDVTVSSLVTTTSSTQVVYLLSFSPVGLCFAFERSYANRLDSARSIAAILPDPLPPQLRHSSTFSATSTTLRCSTKDRHRRRMVTTSGSSTCMPSRYIEKQLEAPSFRRTATSRML